MTEYGSAENEKQFPYLLKYSPYQNVKAGTAYPAVMFFTGDSDTRVDPLHARKMTALLQAASIQRPADSAALQPGRRPLGRGERGPAGAGRRRPADVPVDGNGAKPPIRRGNQAGSVAARSGERLLRCATVRARGARPERTMPVERGRRSTGSTRSRKQPAGCAGCDADSGQRAGALLRRDHAPLRPSIFRPIRCCWGLPTKAACGSSLLPGRPFASCRENSCLRIGACGGRSGDYLRRFYASPLCRFAAAAEEAGRCVPCQRSGALVSIKRFWAR
jgi:hypothetical protein